MYHKFECAGQVANLQATHTDGQVNPDRENQHNQGDSPNLVIHPFKCRCKLIPHVSFLFLFSNILYSKKEALRHLSGGHFRLNILA